ncbi:hypothetical protein FE784_19905 [Paenibacillus hemerocallicola]|uniref:Uncharacterized protein n=1 Tax=Paenibacillus hemerocallicola TaxID=1172614 RepID=A0A5C4T628_9BACL|nr:hypothetical protein [Paenibacillus hemerocallicola]TNJ64544.1 hypothetical protein FE784_19905 [Paenibacillus hemerocallicola]
MSEKDNQAASQLPIDPEYIYKRATLHKRINELSYRDAEAALAFLRDWAEGKKHIEQLWEEVAVALGAGA